MIASQPLLTPFESPALTLPNRVVMAPMTRSRADNAGAEPTALLAEYYRQRASAGLLISEGIYVSTLAAGYIHVPGLYTPAQVAGWQQVTQAVHAAGGRLFAQLWHVGRMSHPDLLGGQLPLSPSALNPHDKVYTPAGFQATVTPQAMTRAQIQDTVADFARAAHNALAAGFDGVEIHAANGYLFHQFFNAPSNTRTDEYGGSVANRARLLFDVLDALPAAGVPLAQVGVRLNPSFYQIFGTEIDAETIPTFDYIVERLNGYSLAYLHLCEPFVNVSQVPFAETHIARRYRPRYRGTLLINGGFDQAKGNQVLADSLADLVSFGTAFIANPDLVNRFDRHAPLTQPNRATYYTPGPAGYIDYPALA